ncbi:MAG TPA: hypothetical protein DEA69_00850 [Microbacterium sp.]|uniref:hypothetical protein n=1 Tax=unclassified Microbacterium TaxID=2609290 RepID=UPI000C45CEAB|nr:MULTISPECIES: hypothetical protein [unclassified Microbacterium]MBU20703.1 hypothetical protein [Microbacterium sp.]HBS07349.1 hypothetical protein [Microbacterium sp.]
MKDDPLRREIEAELRALRTKPAPLSLEQIADAYTLTDVIGRGSTERALSVLMDAYAQHGSEAGSDVRAYFETCGIGLDGQNLNQRLEAYERTHFVDRRTGLRRSDRGASKLSAILRDGAALDRPWAKLAVSEVDGLVTMGLLLDIPKSAQWRRPHVYINGQQIEREFELHDSKKGEHFVSAKERFDSIPLRPTTEEPQEDEFEAHVFWIMPIWPVWVISANLKSPGLGSSFVTERESGATVTMWR